MIASTHRLDLDQGVSQHEVARRHLAACIERNRSPSGYCINSKSTASPGVTIPVGVDLSVHELAAVEELNQMLVVIPFKADLVADDLWQGRSVFYTRPSENRRRHVSAQTHMYLHRHTMYLHRHKMTAF